MAAPIQGSHLSPFARGVSSERSDEKKGSASLSFGEMLQEAFNGVNQAQLESERLSRSLATGDIQDVHQVMMATEKANLALQLTISIRNKVIDAYQEISRMQI